MSSFPILRPTPWGLRAAWSQPLLSKNQQVLGTFGMCYTEPRTPSETDLRLIEGAAHIAVIAIEGERSQAALTRALDEIAKSEAELRTIIDAIPQLITAIGADGNFLYANQAVLEYTGLTKRDRKALLRSFIRRIPRGCVTNALRRSHDVSHSSTNAECGAGTVSIVGS